MAVSSRLSESPNGAGLLLNSATCTLPGGDELPACVGAPIPSLLEGVKLAGGEVELLGVGMADGAGGVGALRELPDWAAG